MKLSMERRKSMRRSPVSPMHKGSYVKGMKSAWELLRGWCCLPPFWEGEGPGTVGRMLLQWRTHAESSM